MHTHTDTTVHTPHRHRRWTCRLDTDPTAVLTARTLTATALTGWDTDLTHDAVLVTSELVTNALTHGTPPVTLTLTLHTEPHPAITLEVTDTSPALPVQHLPGEIGHFGLWIAEELARLTIHPTGTGKTIRAELTTYDPPTTP